MKKYIVSLILLVFPLLAISCRSDIPGAEAAGLQLALTTASDMNVVGETTLLLTIESEDGALPDLASVTARGDMTHAGMTPVIVEIDDPSPEMEIPWEWTMGGDWIVTVEVELADGSLVQETFDLSVSGESMDMEDMDNDMDMDSEDS